jgi:hypothetical protein
MVKQNEALLQPTVFIAAIAASRSEADATQVRHALQIYQDSEHQSLAMQGIVIADLLEKLDLDTETLVAALL